MSVFYLPKSLQSLIAIYSPKSLAPEQTSGFNSLAGSISISLLGLRPLTIRL
jgi:hypothetical protein